MNTKNTFIQNLKDTTTVLQQLRVCIDAIKEFYDNPQFDAKSYVDEKILEVNESINAISQEIDGLDDDIDGLNDDIDGVEGRVTTLEGTHTYCISLLFGLGEDLEDSHFSYTCSVNTYISATSEPSISDATTLALDKIAQNEFVINNAMVYEDGEFDPLCNLVEYDVVNGTSHINLYFLRPDASEFHGILDVANVANTKICKVA